MKKLFYFTCITMSSILFFYIIGAVLNNSINILLWTAAAHIYFTAAVVNLILFTTLWMVDQPWAQPSKTKEYSAFRLKTRLIYYKVIDALRAD